MSEIGKKRRVSIEIDRQDTIKRRASLLNQSFSSDDSGCSNSPARSIDSEEDFDE